MELRRGHRVHVLLRTHSCVPLHEPVCCLFTRRAGEEVVYLQPVLRSVRLDDTGSGRWGGGGPGHLQTCVKLQAGIRQVRTTGNFPMSVI
jgi:hypothetical protein